MSYYNPFQNIEIGVSKENKAFIDLYSRTQPKGGKAPPPETHPFNRMVDFWFFSFCLGIKEGKKREIKNFEKIITGEILSRNPERITFIESTLITETESINIIDDPKKMMKLANEYANYGISELVEILRNGRSKALDNVTDYLTI